MKRTGKIITGALISIALVYCALVIVAYLPQQTTPIEKLAGKEDKFIEVKGRMIHYVLQGKGKPLILVHGFAGSTYTWRHVIPLLTDHYTVYALDLLGFGLSDKPPQGNYDMESQGNLLISFMDALQLPSATLVGHSMGGVVVSYAALTARSKVDALVLIEPGFYSTGTPVFLKYLFFPLDRIMARQFYTKSFRKKFLLRSFYNRSLVTDEVVEAYMLPTRTPNAVESLAHMMKSVGHQHYGGITVKISHPTLIVWGERGGRSEAGEKFEFAERIKREIRGSRLVYIKESGHYVQEEKPQELARAIRKSVG